MFIVLEFLGGPNLREVSSANQLNMESIAFFMAGILLGIEYMHWSLVCHG